MSYFQHHVFFCCNRREDGGACCEDHQAERMLMHAKQKIAALGLSHKIRINRAGCLGLCDRGPVVVVYPDAVWYSYKNEQDVDEIINEHLLHNRPVSRLIA